MGICILHLMGDDLKLLRAYFSADKREYERKSMFPQSESNSRLSDKDTFFHALCLKKSCHDLTTSLVAHIKLNIGRCILGQTKGFGIAKIFLEAQLPDPSYSLLAKVFNTFFH